MEKDLNYFMSLPYIVELKRIPIEDGGGFSACIPQLGRHSLLADGETIEEAVQNLEVIKRERFAEYIQAGLIIPEPEREEEDYSGKFVLRIPKYLHRELALTAKQNDVSLNQLVVSMLAGGVENHRWSSKLSGLQAEVRILKTHFTEMDYEFRYDRSQT
ncbi:MAG: toxin-antitoxin system HicB family antitoxin [Syntrophaceae bacterium]|nr:toxin-antitoxin system HicB family antitoxin [Syntrophaceae bacterium]